MHIEINSETFKNSSFADIKKILSVLSYKKRYTFHLDYTDILNSPNFMSLDKSDQEVIRESYAYNITSGLKKTHEISDSLGKNIFNIQESILYFDQPLLIILENNLNDSYLFTKISEVYSDVIVNSLNNLWIKYENAGGCTNIINCIESYKKTYNKISRNGYRFIRCFVLVDSDKKSPTSGTTPERDNLEKYLTKHNITFHILEKREMENYMPDIVFSTFLTGHNDYKDAYLRLSDIQKDFFDIEKGFNSRKRFNQLPTEIQTLYESISEDDKTTFRNNDLKKLNGSTRENFKTDFPQFFESELVTKELLEQRISHQNNSNELRDIIDKVESLL